jgi:hypothetical protein
MGVSREENRMPKLLDKGDSNSGPGVETGIKSAITSWVVPLVKLLELLGPL